MGLDLTAYSNVKLVQPESEEIGCLVEYCDELSDDTNTTNVVLYVNKHFPLQSEGLETGIYSYNNCFGNFSCSYGTYSHLRNIISRLAGNKPITKEDLVGVDDVEKYLDWHEDVRLPYQLHTFNNPEDKLYRLINFSDCKGTINHESCVIITNELEEVYESIKDNEDMDFHYDKRNIEELLSVFKFAARNNGVVAFN